MSHQAAKISARPAKSSLSGERMVADCTLLFPPLVATALNGPPLGIQHLAAFANRRGFSCDLFDLNLKYARQLVSDAGLSALNPEPADLRARLRSAFRLAPEARLDDGSQVLTLATNDLACPRGPMDRFAESLTLSSFLQDVAAQPSRVLGISILCAEQVSYACLLAESLRRVAPDSLLMVGGPEVTFMSPESLRASGLAHLFDVIVRGDGELPLVEALAGQRLEPLVSGPRTSLREVPLDAAFRMDIRGYARPQTWNMVESSGCYWNKCTHCDYIALHEKVDNTRSLEELVAEVTRHARRSGVSRIHFVNDTLAPARARKLAAEVSRQRSPIRWNSFVKIDARFSRSILDTLPSGGCEFLVIGLESLSDGPLATLEKGYSASEAMSWMHDADAAGVPLVINLIVGVPGSTSADDDETLERLAMFPKLATRTKLFRFVLSSASAMGRTPSQFGLIVLGPKGTGHRGTTSMSYEDHGLDGRERSFRSGLAALIRRKRLAGNVGRALLSATAGIGNDGIRLQLIPSTEVMPFAEDRALVADAKSGVVLEVPSSVSEHLKALRANPRTTSELVVFLAEEPELLSVLIELAGFGLIRGAEADA